MDCQDWEVIKVGRSNGAGVGVGAGSGGRKSIVPKYSESVIRQAKLDNDVDGLPKSLKKHLSSESRQEMIKKRVEMGLTQVKLNQQCSFPINTIRDFENGTVVPNGTQLNILSRTLGICMKLE
jgi:ribosome-binding protein aMBF1 (putative translation factor)